MVRFIVTIQKNRRYDNNEQIFGTNECNTDMMRYAWSHSVNMAHRS